MSYGLTAAETGPLASYLTNLWGGYSLTKLRSLYTGNAIRVRRSSDNTEQDIGFSGTALDTSALATFVGANDGFIAKWYDQSGGGDDLAQATSTKQPKIVDAGTYVGELLWDGADDYLSTANNSGTPTGLTVHIAGRNRAPVQGASGAVSYLYVRTDALLAQSRFLSGNTYRTNAGTGATGLNGNDTPVAKDGSVYSCVHDRTAGTLATQSVVYVNGSAQTSAGTSGSTASSTFTAAPWFIGSNSSGANCMRLAARTILIYETAQSSGTVASIAALIPPPVVTDGLDSFTTSLWALLGIRRMLSGYGSGALLRVRRSSDNTEQDVGSDATTHLLDVAAMLTFCGAGNGFITKIYDQSGGGNHFVQATSANQPQIVSSGVYLGSIQFDGSNDHLSSVNNSNSSKAAYTLLTKGAMRTNSDTVLLELSTNTNSFNSLLVEPGLGGGIGAPVHSTAPTYSASVFQTTLVGQVMAFIGDRSATGAANESRGFNGGAPMTRDGNSDSGGTPISGSYDVAAWFLGARSGGVAPAPFNFEACAIYEAALSDADIDRCCRGIG